MLAVLVSLLLVFGTKAKLRLLECLIFYDYMTVSLVHRGFQIW